MHRPEQNKDFSDESATRQAAGYFYKKNSHRQILGEKGEKAYDFDDYIQFLSVMNHFSNHPVKPFKKIEGTFII